MQSSSRNRSGELLGDEAGPHSLDRAQPQEPPPFRSNSVICPRRSSSIRQQAPSSSRSCARPRCTRAFIPGIERPSFRGRLRLRVVAEVGEPDRFPVGVGQPLHHRRQARRDLAAKLIRYVDAPRARAGRRAARSAPGRRAARARRPARASSRRSRCGPPGRPRRPGDPARAAARCAVYRRSRISCARSSTAARSGTRRATNACRRSCNSAHIGSAAERCRRSRSGRSDGLSTSARPRSGCV